MLTQSIDIRIIQGCRGYHTSFPHDLDTSAWMLGKMGSWVGSINDIESASSHFLFLVFGPVQAKASCVMGHELDQVLVRRATGGGRVIGNSCLNSWRRRHGAGFQIWCVSAGASGWSQRKGHAHLKLLHELHLWYPWSKSPAAVGLEPQGTDIGLLSTVKRARWERASSPNKTHSVLSTVIVLIVTHNEKGTQSTFSESLPDFH